MTESLELEAGRWTMLPVQIGVKYQIQNPERDTAYYSAPTVLLSLSPAEPAPGDRAAWSLPPLTVATVKRTGPDFVWLQAVLSTGDGEEPAAGRLVYEAVAA